METALRGCSTTESMQACLHLCYHFTMSQVTWRASEELVERVRRCAQRSGHSMNEYLTSVLDAATDPELATDEADRVRERLHRAGLLAPAGVPASRERPDPQTVERARQAAGEGTPLSEFVRQDRG